MARQLDIPAAAAGAVALLAAAWAVAAGVVPPSESMPAVLAPAVFVLAGLLGPLWRAATFTCRLLVGIGTAHLLAIACSATAQSGSVSAPAWHVPSLLLYVAGFALLLPLAAGYPAGPAGRSAWAVAGALCELPVLAVLSAPTPAVLAGAGVPRLIDPILPLLPAWVAAVSAVVFAAPVVAVGIAVTRTARGDRETRGRLLLPLGALAGFAALVALGTLVPPSAAPVTTALFLVSIPLVPIGLVAGSRPLVMPLDARPTLPPVHGAALERLSPREREVLAAMAAGESNAAIGRRLHLSLSSVEKHTTAIFSKLELSPDDATHRRVAAVVAYLRSAAR